MSTGPDTGPDELRAELIDRLESLADTLRGPRNLAVSTRRTWRWGRKGSLALEVSGRKRGVWKDHEADTGGGPLQWIMHERRCSFPEAVLWARAWTGLPEGERRTPDESVKCERERKSAAAEIEKAADEAQRIAGARRMWATAGAVAGTTAEVYLSNTRKIPRPAAGWPDAVRFHAATNSLMLAVTTADGALQAVQRVHLTRDAEKAEASPGRWPKHTNDPLRDAVVRLPGDPSRPLLVAEGPETGLSAWATTGYETWVCLGGIARLTPPMGRRMVICRDDDPPWSSGDRKHRDAVKTWRQQGIDLAVVTPWPERRHNKTDLNNTLKDRGADAVRARIEAALQPASGRRRLPKEDARRVLAGGIARFNAAFDAYESEHTKEAVPPVHMMRVDVALGKTQAALEWAAERLTEMRARGDQRTFVVAVPMADLGDEQAQRFEALPAARAIGLTAAVWRGRERPDPEDPDFHDCSVAAHQRTTMCRNLDAVREAQSVLADVQTSVCVKKMTEKGEDRTVQCLFYDFCGYQRQRRLAADVWFVAHELLFTTIPAALGGVAAVIVDESVWRKGLIGVDPRHPTKLSLDTLWATDRVPGDPMATDRLTFLRRRAFDVTQLADGPLPRGELLDVFSPEMAREANGLEWRRHIDPNMHPGMTSADIKEAKDAAKANMTISRMTMFWTALESLVSEDGPEASGWISTATERDETGSRRVLHLKGRKKIGGGFRVPTLVIDATLDPDLVRRYFPQAELTADVAAETPHQRVRQVIDASYSKHRLEPRTDKPAEDQRRRQRNLRDLHATVGTFCRQSPPGPVLIVAQKTIEEALPSLGRLPVNATTAHHNAVAGRDEWRDVSGLVVVGRTAPSPANVELLAEALTGAGIDPLPGWYPRVVVSREMADGGAIEAEADRHPDPIAEAIRWQVCEGELLQIIGRARGVNRTAADPVDVLVLCDVPLAVPIDGTLSASDLAPSPAELMLAAGASNSRTRPTRQRHTRSFGLRRMRPAKRRIGGA